MDTKCDATSINDTTTNSDELQDPFLNPAKVGWRFSMRLLRKRRRQSELDTLTIIREVESEEKIKKRRTRRLTSVTSSLVSVFSNNKPVMKVGEALQRTWSGVKISSSSPMAIGMPLPDSVPTSPSSSPGKNSGGFSPPKRNQPTPCRQRGSRLWTETVAAQLISQQLPEQEIQRQEAIFELYQGEEDMVEDLHLVKTAYHDSLRHLNIMTAKELQDIFGSMHTLAPLHQDLLDKLLNLRNANGTTDCIGSVLIQWIPGLTQYIAYCANQVHAKALLDEKKTHDKRLEDFLQRCLESPFSRKLDLWNFLDVPRSRLVKYPLLFKNILKLTPEGHPDVETISASIIMVEDIIRKVDNKTGEAECNFVISKLDYLDEKQRDPLIWSSTVLLCSGVLRNTRGTKLNVFLFNKILVLTRPASRDHGLVYQVYRQPIPAEQLFVEDLKDGEVKMGSFRNAFSHNPTAKNLFRVSFRDSSLGHAHTLLANDSHDKKQWLHNLRKVSHQLSPTCSLNTGVSMSAAIAVSLPAPMDISSCCSSSSSSLSSSVAFTTSTSIGGTAAAVAAAAAAAGLLATCNNNNNNNNDPFLVSGPLQRHRRNNSSKNGRNKSTTSAASTPPPARILRKRASDNSLQVQSIEAACRGSLTCLFTTESHGHGHNGHSQTTLFV